MVNVLKFKAASYKRLIQPHFFHTKNFDSNIHGILPIDFLTCRLEEPEPNHHPSN